MLSRILGKNDKEKKEELIRSMQSLHHYVHKYFSITSKLLEFLNTHMEQNICPAVSVNDNESIEQNCGRVREVMLQIVDVCEREDRHVHKSIEPDLYEKIAFSVVSLKDKVTVIKELHENTMGILGNVFCPFVIIKLVRSDLRNVMPPADELKSLPVSSFVLGDLVRSSEYIPKLLNKEKTFVEAVQLVQDLLSILKPPCDSYCDILSELQAYVTIISENI
ncbi:single-pass membrane and coiled-coil domain-containing protein 3-like isoform X2 [Triplophysa dalaica]|uniref:single-pass membrane and coiled-coil domain-containing protein 3-like isoform X2 n=1 Tax=Triplophysa dalaica TaxID=1582913 RepID=UPI0024DFC931|nr:single-pass membrane and coiled-coil domain-containing protein 3-like isoform X2 [Triplophysa dalaica]